MNLKKTILTLIGTAVTCTLLAGNALAATQWAACTPKQIGPYGEFVRIQVINCNVNPAGTKNGWMTLSPVGTDQMMATILTAMSLGKGIGIAFENTNTNTDAEGYNHTLSIILNNQ